jgi:O-antigen/teichoic acid export membrane protein
MKALRKTTGFGFWQMLNILGGIFSAQSQRLLLGMMLTVISVGFYNIAAQIVNMVYMLALKIGQVLFPEISSLQGKGEEEKAAYLVVKTNWFVTIIVMSVYVALVVLIPDFLILWVGPDVAKETISVARILVIGVSIGSVFAIPSNFLLGTARGKWLAMMAFAQGILVLISSALLIPQFGLSGAGWGTTIGTLTHIVVLFLMWKIIFIKWLPGKIYFTPLIAPMGMAYIVAFILLYIKSDSIWATTWLKCGFLGISCVIVSASIFFLFDAVLPGGKQRRSFLYSLIGRIQVTH